MLHIKQSCSSSLFTGTASVIHLFLNNAHLTLPPLPSRGTATEKHLLLVARKLKISMRAVWPFFSKKENKEKYKKKKKKKSEGV